MSTKRKAFVSSSAFPLKKAHLQTDAYYGMTLSRIGPGLVISRSEDGSIISLFDDDEWFLPAFDFSVKDKPYFNFFPFRQEGKFNSENIATCKRLLTIKMFSTKSKTGKAIRLPTMQSLLTALNHLRTFSDKRSMRIEEIFGKKSIFEEMQASLPTSYNKSLLGLMRTLVSIDSADRGFLIDGSILPFFEKATRDSRKEGDQYAVIPSRILWAKYKQYKERLDDYLKDKNAIHSFIEASIDNRFFGRSDRARFMYQNEFMLLPAETRATQILEPLTFWKAIDKYKLTRLAKKYNWSSTMSPSRFLSLVQYCAKCLIHLFTLMRDSEVLNLPVDCLEPIRGWNDEALYLCGTSTKLEGEKTDAKWITTDDIREPVQVLQSIQKLVAGHVESDIKVDWLLLAASNLPYSGNSSKKGIAIAKNLEARLPPAIITDADIRELETIDPYRNWRDDKKFKVGQPWRITSHQFRRSIAVFAGQSGLITLPSLKRLLRHITKAMSTYYMKGCSAKNYLFSDINPKLTLELKRAKEEADAALFIRDVLKSAEQMYGLAGRRAMEMRKESPWLAGTEAQTNQQVKLGLMAYEETPAGGCTSPTPCDKRAHAKMDTCLGCKQFVGQESRMDETIEIMEFDLAGLKVGTIEYRAELQNLKDFKALRARI
ncbi:integrase [Pseudomonas sp. S12(2018)]|uniref:integrase n=1 Tax=Pseudomonas sp. S12(2018) TaxID=2219664 RepID=UPI0020CD0BBE|nr:integrase [Pseudomonas sp. S12(2018)]MCQ0170166.1 integrase [Pseudomonas sp. S12(2018)]